MRAPYYPLGCRMPLLNFTSSLIEIYDIVLWNLEKPSGHTMYQVRLNEELIMLPCPPDLCPKACPPTLTGIDSAPLTRPRSTPPLAHLLYQTLIMLLYPAQPLPAPLAPLSYEEVIVLPYPAPLLPHF
jgi:hypothetical protein